jgi:hypothetical protein
MSLPMESDTRSVGLFGREWFGKADHLRVGVEVALPEDKPRDEPIDDRPDEQLRERGDD